jgi:hypothetical protein
MVISSADAMCLNDEEKWSSRAKYEYVNGVKTKTDEVPVPLFQLRSMAQTRACAKALRNILAWVVVLGGFKPMPAEEMTDGLNSHTEPKPEIKQPVKKEKPAEDKPAETAPKHKAQNPISIPQSKRLFAIAMGNGYTAEDLNIYLQENYGISDSQEIEREHYEAIVEKFQEKRE